MTKRRNYTRMLCEGAILVALAEILGFLKIGHLPNGGSISLMMLPIVVFALRWGLGSGLLAGFVLGVVDFMIAGGIAIGWQSIIGDYVVACTLIGLAGAGHYIKNLGGVILGAVLGCAGRFLAVTTTGATIWGDLMPETFLGLPMSNEWIYSLLYNGITVGASAVVTVVVCVVLYQIGSVRKYLLGEDIPQ